MLTGRIFDAEEADRIGLVVDVVDDDALLDAAYAKAERDHAQHARSVWP